MIAIGISVLAKAMEQLQIFIGEQKIAIP